MIANRVGNRTAKVKFVCYGALTNWNMKNSTQKMMIEKTVVEQSVPKVKPKKNDSFFNSGYFIRKSKIEAATNSDNVLEVFYFD